MNYITGIKLIDMMINVNLPQRTVLGTCLLLLGLVCGTFVYTLWQWHNDWTLAHQQGPSPTFIKPSNEKEKIIASIPEAHLFGRPAIKTATISEVPISSLQLKVTGIVKQNYGPSKVFISTAGAPSKIYKMGDNITSGVKVYDITADTIILENNGRMEKLPLLREKLQFKPRMKEGL